MSYSIEQITELTGATRIGKVEATIDWLLTENTQLSFPEETLYFAIPDKQNGEEKIIADLYARGVRNFVVEVKNTWLGNAAPVNYADYPACNFLEVSNALKTLQKLVEKHRSNYHIPMIGVTGSTGKTIVKEWLYQLLSQDRIVARSPYTSNGQIGVPLSVWQINDQSQLAIIEAKSLESGEMRALQSIIQPTIGVFTSIGRTSQERFSSLQEKCEEALGLFKDCDVIIYNGDDEFIRDSVGKSLFSAREIAWSRVDTDKPLFITSVKKGDTSAEITYQYLGMENSYCFPFTDDISINYSINCLAVCLYLMLPPEEITARMAKLRPIASRLELKNGKRGCVLIDDSYDLDINTLEAALEFQYRHAENKKMEKTLILSDILDTDKAPNVLYKRVGQLLDEHGITRLIAVGRELASAASRFEMKCDFFPDTDALFASGVMQLLNHEIVLIKGARTFNFERIVDYLELKDRDTVLKVNLNALINNLNYFRNKLLPTTRTLCMVKAGAYGAGAVEVSKALRDEKVDYLGVATADQGVEIREAGVTTSIIVTNPIHSSLKKIFRYSLEAEIYNFRILEEIIHSAEREGMMNVPIHIKVNTGMNRMGFDVAELPMLIRKLKEQNTVIPRSIFSHLAGSDGKEFDEFTHQQIALFDKVSSEFQAAFSHRILRHIANSAAVERFPELAQFDMVRLGIGLYGVNPCDNSIINNVSTLQSTIIQLRDVAEGETVGYSRRGKIVKPTRIAVLRIGYGDGLDRHLGNGNFYCLVNGQKAPYVGNICMDLCMIDVTGIACREGDKAVIFGDDLPVTMLADQLGTIPYEVLTNMLPRVKRVYIRE
ncbi:bifunctional UDP-N-acetylmuramoyl-tripeptide:D-alanyl-D-alanine ligase/alanine racemase [Bacteroides sp. 214]|uniref:bifunctional UDP-N-acetylmuramoyl-tripeptide:D-alanyl-D-alanine ligase/alanine racemase n=1 Tax=Bacteroides sp. 214 TaxID=2302935 RepID=UPI0013CFED21|nr:bifunctional UDP-N-acetylmuramoyl-tripeptide:D-alanyl-D-alanine ligase/alanine racemase [Bacteroides sp. 214]NDW13020.1 bifunctional UDP-N-acetylmuramoyl-tripeptide:D-alanyl-D-alanine ligase/alanine racemase [Bacteroides sp. 214]